MALGHLDELQMAEKYPIRWSLKTGFTVYLFYAKQIILRQLRDVKLVITSSQI